jgi:hypothetical protein
MRILTWFCVLATTSVVVSCGPPRPSPQPEIRPDLPSQKCGQVGQPPCPKPLPHPVVPVAQPLCKIENPPLGATTLSLFVVSLHHSDNQPDAKTPDAADVAQFADNFSRQFPGLIPGQSHQLLIASPASRVYV